MGEVYLRFEKEFDLKKQYKWKSLNKYLSSIDPEFKNPTYNNLDEFF